MVADAEEYWKKNPILYEKFKKLSWKLTLEEDPRITKVGKILRQTSIDEFPQLYNILKGDMSLVGPRPIRKLEIADAVKRYGKEIKPTIDESLTVKPGLTGAWQVSGRNTIPWDQRVKMDADYAKRKNILDDFA
ncbi:sugar transferase, partial [Candidatus Collierbacteria bacterium]|nr:sugar transferase [Candidatus Collierbacteria bacterium]